MHVYVYTTGNYIDMRARIPLWQNGMDYNHGTGHGIGYWLNVHEGDPKALFAFLELPACHLQLVHVICQLCAISHAQSYLSHSVSHSLPFFKISVQVRSFCDVNIAAL